MHSWPLGAIPDCFLLDNLLCKWGKTQGGRRSSAHVAGGASREEGREFGNCFPKRLLQCSA
eukprot:1609444-Pleurochrysis_carterae.AAC.2